jgi:hypothetical protein
MDKDIETKVEINDEGVVTKYIRLPAKNERIEIDISNQLFGEWDEINKNRVLPENTKYSDIGQYIIKSFMDNDFRIISYLMYPAGIRCPLITHKTDDTDITNSLEPLYERIINKLEDAKLPVDNKIVVEIEPIYPINKGCYERITPLFFSMKDGVYSIGLECFQHDGIEPIYL